MHSQSQNSFCRPSEVKRRHRELLTACSGCVSPARSGDCGLNGLWRTALPPSPASVFSVQHHSYSVTSLAFNPSKPDLLVRCGGLQLTTSLLKSIHCQLLIGRPVFLRSEEVIIIPFYLQPCDTPCHCGLAVDLELAVDVDTAYFRSGIPTWTLIFKVKNTFYFMTPRVQSHHLFPLTSGERQLPFGSMEAFRFLVVWGWGCVSG